MLCLDIHTILNVYAKPKKNTNIELSIVNCF